MPQDGANRDVQCEVVRWVANEPFPGIVEARLVDRRGRSFLFRDKAAIFSSEALSARSTFPALGEMRCRVLGRRRDDQGGFLVIRLLDTDSDGVQEFEVREAQLRAIPP